MSKVVILGIGPFGRLARQYFDADSEHEVVAFTAHERFMRGGEVDGLPVLPFEVLERRFPPEEARVFVGAGYSRVNRDRSDLFDAVRRRGYGFASYTSSRAIVWPGTPLGDSTFLFEGVTLQPGVVVSDGVLIWSGSTICHDSSIEEFCFLGSNVVVSGNVRLGHHTFAGANATFRDGVTTGAYTVVGAGARIMADTDERAVHSARGTKARGDDSWSLESL